MEVGSLDSNRLVGICLVTVVGFFVLGRGDVVQRAVEADGIEPGDPGQGGELDVVDGHRLQLPQRTSMTRTSALKEILARPQE